MVGAINGQIQKPGDKQGRQTHGAGGGGQDAAETLFVAIPEHLQDGRMEELLLLVFRQVPDTQGGEVLDPLAVGMPAGVAGDYYIGFAAEQGFIDLFLQGQGHAVDLVEGIGEVGQLGAGLAQSGLGGAQEAGEDLLAEVPILREGIKGRKIGQEQQIDHADDGEGLEEIQEMGAADPFQEPLVEFLD